jgi:hypothetical protein
MLHLGEWRGRQTSIERPSSRVCESAGLRTKERQVVYHWREDCSEQSTGVLLLGKQGHCIGS